VSDLEELVAGSEGRACALVALAGDLRAHGCFDEALQALDLAWHLSPREAIELEMYACAVAIHCDRGDFKRALTIERSFAERGIDLRLALAFERLHAELFTLGGGRQYGERRDFYRAFVGLLDAFAA
jgi:hypothetical protein